MRVLSRPFGLWILGRADEEIETVARRVRILLTLSIVVANLVGAVTVFALAAFVVPPPPGVDTDRAILVNLIAAAGYVAISVTLGVAWGSRAVLERVAWLLEGRAPDEREQKVTLRLPLVLFRIQIVLWTAAVAFFTTVNGLLDADLISHVALTVTLGGLVTCANAYLLSELVLRPIAARALQPGPPERMFVPGVRARMLLAWALGSAVPVIGLIFVAIADLSGRDVSATRLSISILALGGVMLVFGLVLALLASRAISDPVRSVRSALTSVERGDLDVEVPVYDGTEVGLLQAGFNRMVIGLREREHIRDLFGRHVGEHVAHAALEEGEVALGGEVREVAVLFVDIVGSTTLAATRPPEEVVALLNRFFAVVVDVVSEHGGLINKFQGDAALAIFGAPIPLDDPSGAALAAARTLAEGLRAEVPELDAGTGVSAGSAVAGNIGAEQRFEYTVIGDPVNEAARLSELAKEASGRVLASAAALERAGGQERERWQLGDEVELRGRPEGTRLATPA